jgi:hypothetical protein
MLTRPGVAQIAPVEIFNTCSFQHVFSSMMIAHRNVLSPGMGTLILRVITPLFAQNDDTRGVQLD